MGPKAAKLVGYSVAPVVLGPCYLGKGVCRLPSLRKNHLPGWFFRFRRLRYSRRGRGSTLDPLKSFRFTY